MKKISYLTVFLLLGCSSVPQTAEEYWFGQGERFGSRGYNIETDALAKMKEKVPFNEAAYLDGYNKGISEYCDPFQAFEKGIRGVRYTGQCDEQKEVVMIKAEWQRGWDAFIGYDFGYK